MRRMAEIIPSINAATFEEVEQRIRLVERYVNWAHLDVADGTFTQHISWHTPQDLLRLKTRLSIEVHLMVDHIDEAIERWLLPNIRRNIFHIEAAQSPEYVIDACHKKNIEAGIAIRPDTSHEKLRPYYKKADFLQTLAVMPGPSGQEFKQETFEKISRLRKECPSCLLEVDGGVTATLAPQLVKAGATHLVAGAAIFNVPDMEHAIRNLKNAATPVSSL